MTVIELHKKLEEFINQDMGNLEVTFSVYDPKDPCPYDVIIDNIVHYDETPY